MAFNREELSIAMAFCNAYEKDVIMPKLPSTLCKDFKKAKGLVKYLSKVILGEFLGGVLGRRRIELHSALIEHSGIDRIAIESEKKTICFTNYVDTVLVAKNYFEKRGFEPLVVYSETNSEVNAILNDFRTSDTANPLIATIQSLSTGVTLICANTCIFLNLPWRSGDYEQASNRIFRIGQTAQVYLYDIILDTGDLANLSTRIQDILTWSKDQVNLMMNADGVIGVAMEGMLDYILVNEQCLLDINEVPPTPGLSNAVSGLEMIMEELTPTTPIKKKTSALDWD